ncbi:MAG: ferredoxin [Acidobacteria bacterium]|nr:ferredoxin [Acidobacteriota bacterium]
MEKQLQHQIAFYLTGRIDKSTLEPVDGRLRPALLSRYADLDSLRYDFPLVLNRLGAPGRAVLSLSRMVDHAVAELGENVDHERVARHGYRIEHALRKALAGGAEDFAALWERTTAALEREDEALHDSAKRLWKAFQASGELVDAGAALPAKAVRHAWSAVQTAKAAAFRYRAERLLLKLKNILAAEEIGSTVGRTPERLQAGVGSSFAGAFDFDAMSRILVAAKPAVELSDERRRRIGNLIGVLERQKFYALETDGAEPYDFAFERCADALDAYRSRHAEAVELVKTLAVAELEAKGEYREAVHDMIFDGFGANGLDAGELAELPDYLVCVDGQTLDAAELARIVELLAAGLPVKILVRTDDVLEPAFVAEGHVTFGLRARQLVNTAIGLHDVFVFQAAASHLFKKKDALMRGLAYHGPALFSVFSGANAHTGQIPAYLVAAAAMESRVFPALVYDPSAGADWASRLDITDNPHPDDDWAVHSFSYEDENLQSQTETIAFTLADFMAMDERFFKNFAVVPKADWSASLIPVAEAFQIESKGLPEKVPAVLLVDDEFRLQRAILSSRAFFEVQRCRSMWHSLQELGGIHNSHAERLLAQERKARAAAAAVETPALPTAGAVEPAAPPDAPASAAAEAAHGDEPYIESERCSSCNECVQLNGEMFAYNENQQAYLKNPDAGTFRQLVEAAEGCQVSVIHPGKPRNPKEPGLEDLLKRAAAFN